MHNTQDIVPYNEYYDFMDKIINIDVCLIRHEFMEFFFVDKSEFVDLIHFIFLLLCIMLGGSEIGTS